MMKNIQLLAILLLWVAAGCKKDKESDQDKCSGYTNQVTKLDNEIRKYVFKKGTYWIYQDPDTEALDSVYVSEYSDIAEGLVKFQGTHCDSVAVQRVSMTWKSTFYPGNDVTWVAEGTSPGFLFIKDRGLLSPVFWLKDKETYKRDCSAYYGSYPLFATEHGDFFSIDEFVIENSNGVCVTDYQYRSDLYFSPKVGIVKKYIFDTPNGSDEWDLIRWKIVQ